jgi:hypothetical protein
LAKQTAANLSPLDPLQRYTVDEASAYLRQSRAKTYLDIAAGVLESFNDGRRRYVPGTAIAARSRPGAAS